MIPCFRESLSRMRRLRHFSGRRRRRHRLASLQRLRRRRRTGRAAGAAASIGRRRRRRPREPRIRKAGGALSAGHPLRSKRGRHHRWSAIMPILLAESYDCARSALVEGSVGWHTHKAGHVVCRKGLCSILRRLKAPTRQALRPCSAVCCDCLRLPLGQVGPRDGA